MDNAKPKNSKGKVTLEFFYTHYSEKERQQIVQGTYLNVLEDYELDTWIPYNYKWKGILNSYTRKYPAHHVIKAIHTAEYYLQESEYHDNKETIKNFTKKIGGILYNQSKNNT